MNMKTEGSSVLPEHCNEHSWHSDATVIGNGVIRAAGTDFRVMGVWIALQKLKNIEISHVRLNNTFTSSTLVHTIISGLQ